MANAAETHSEWTQLLKVAENLEGFDATVLATILGYPLGAAKAFMRNPDTLHPTGMERMRDFVAEAGFPIVARMAIYLKRSDASLSDLGKAAGITEKRLATLMDRSRARLLDAEMVKLDAFLNRASALFYKGAQRKSKPEATRNSEAKHAPPAPPERPETFRPPLFERGNATPLRLDLLTDIYAISEFTGFSVPELYFMTRANAIPTFRIGSNTCAKRSTILAWIDALEREAIAKMRG